MIINIIITLITGFLIGFGICFYFSRTTKEQQIEAMREWLIWACCEAETVLGSGTGQLKLRYVYDMFVSKYPSLVKFICFEKFSLYVDQALEKFKQMLAQNKQVQSLVQGG